MRLSSIWPENSAATSSRSVRHTKWQSNVFKLLAQREVSPRTRRSPKRFLVKASSCHLDSSGTVCRSAKDSRQELLSWVEAKSLLHLTATYCPLLPPPISTIAAAFSSDGDMLASTHGDHTVKIINYRTGKCLKVLSGHRRTPWVVRFHPLHPEVLASGSLDHEVRVWDAKTAECLGSCNFHRPIASIAFHAQGEHLAVASGHKLYIWDYNKREEASSPSIILKTRRPLRAVQFHPYSSQLLLTAEVNDLNSSDPTMSVATSPGYLCCPPPTIYLVDTHSAHRSNSENELPIMSIPFSIWPSVQDDGRFRYQQTDAHTNATSSEQRVNPYRLMRLTPSTPSRRHRLSSSLFDSSSSPTRLDPHVNYVAREIDYTAFQPAMEIDMHVDEGTNHSLHLGNASHWELPFLQGWLVGQSQAGEHATHRQNSSSRIGGPFVPRHGSSYSRMIPTTGSSNGVALTCIPPEHFNSQSFTSRIQYEVATSLASAAAATSELPRTVKLNLWSHDVKNPGAPIDVQRCRLTIPHAVLFSETGAHFSPCGRFLALCEACVLPNMDANPWFRGQNVVTGASSPTTHLISTQIVYEIRIYSIEEASFGSVVASHAIRAAHCLSSMQFSPTSEHLLLAYGPRHGSLLKSVLIDGDTTVPIYTILEIYRVSDMELVLVVPNAEDEINVASFHPSVGGGLVYGTKEGKLRLLQSSASHGC